MAAGVVSYSKFMAKSEDKKLHLINSLQADISTPQIGSHKGKIFKKMGGGYLAEFPSVVGAIKAAISIQTDIRKLDPRQSNEKVLKLRIGINLGDVIMNDGDIYGNGVNIAARL